MHGIRGKEYPTNLYQIPKIEIGRMSFIKPIMQEHADQFTNDSVFVQDGSAPSPRDPGRLGWTLFYNTNLLVDIQNSKMAFCDSLATLKAQGYSIEKFISAPLLIERGLVEFIAETPKGSLRCLLDTGATWNMLNAGLEEGKSIEQEIWKPENVFEYPFFIIGDQDLGPITMRRVPIKSPIFLGAILGMEFFREHLVFIDFAGKQIYFSKSCLKEDPHDP